MNKSTFLLNTFKNLEIEVIALVNKYPNGVNGNALNKLVKKYENLAYDTDFWWNGNYSTHTKDKNGNWLKLQENNVNFRDLLKRRVEVHLNGMV